MGVERTLLIIKPDAVERNLIGQILSSVESGGFSILSMSMLRLSEPDARRFYKVHEGKPFIDSLVKYMSSGPCVVCVLEGNGAVEKLRKLVGSTDPSQASPGTIRERFGVDKQRNSVHASDSSGTASEEIEFFSGRVETCLR
ncbi:MAG: nucleoside-diphosphate kinase [Candidatus Eisenbacteria bacterium]|nr:nucleoside-diphosphate kinase [Candidatus Eisenbacteria bacterium]